MLALPSEIIEYRFGKHPIAKGESAWVYGEESNAYAGLAETKACAS